MSRARTTSRRWAALFTTLAVACAMFALLAAPASAAPPSNDLIENATVITSLPFTTSYSTQDSTRSPDDPGASCNISGTATTWLRYDAPEDQSVRLSVSGPGLFQVFEGSPGSLTELACGNNFPQPLHLAGAQSYYFMVSELFPSNVSLSLRVAEVPANDLIENATVIQSLPSTTTTGILDATRSDTDPSSCGSAFTTWSRYDAPVDQLVRASVTGAAGEFSPPGLAVFEGAPGSLVLVTCSPSAPLSLVKGHTYYFMVSSSFNAAATLSLRLATPPANDLIENAFAITTLPFTATPSTLDATLTPSDPPANCFFGAVPNVWFRFDATTTQVLRATIAGGSFVPLAVYQGTPGALTQVACGTGTQIVPVTAGQSYYLMMPASVATITLNLAVATPPANDLIENASMIGSIPFSAPLATVDASRSASDPSASCFFGGSPNVWYRYDSPSSQALRVTLTSNFGSSFAVFEGSPGSLTQVTCGSGAQVVPMTADRSYYLMVPVLPGGTGTLAVQVATPPANDLIGNATAITSLPFTTTPPTVDASRSASDPTASCAGAGPNVWYRYDASTSQSLRATFTNSSGFQLVVFDGSPGALTQVACVNGPQALAVTAGHSYYFMVPTIPGATFALQVSTPPANDLIEHATRIESLPYSVSQSTQDATASATDQGCYAPGPYPTVWFRYDAPVTEIVRVSYSASAGAVVVLRGDPGSLATVGCIFSGSQSLTLSKGQSYYFMAATSVWGPITLGVEHVDSAPTLSVPSDFAVDATSPAGAVVEYGATATDDHDWFPVVACDPPSGSTLAIGDTAVDCVATDYAGLSSPHAGFTVHVAGASEQLTRLQADVATLSSKPLRTTLGLSLKAAANALDNGRPTVACTTLGAFVTEVSSVSPKVLSPTLAQELLADATRIRQVIGCTG